MAECCGCIEGSQSCGTKRKFTLFHLPYITVINCTQSSIETLSHHYAVCKLMLEKQNHQRMKLLVAGIRIRSFFFQNDATCSQQVAVVCK